MNNVASFIEYCLVMEINLKSKLHGRDALVITHKT